MDLNAGVISIYTPSGCVPDARIWRSKNGCEDKGPDHFFIIILEVLSIFFILFLRAYPCSRTYIFIFFIICTFYMLFAHFCSTAIANVYIAIANIYCSRGKTTITIAVSNTWSHHLYTAQG
jgi:hypothetical protein